jgi:hypothetical protein
VQPADLAIGLRRRTPWEAMDLGLAMLQRWWRRAYAPHLAVGVAAALAGWAASLWLAQPWVAMLVVWWLKPLYDRVVLHVLSRAVFGEVQSARAVFADWKEWLGAGLAPYLLLRWLPDLSRSFNLPVRQLEGQTGRGGRERRGVLGRRVNGYAVWLTIVCMHFEAVLYWSFGRLTTLFLPAKAFEGRAFTDAFVSGALFSYGDFLAYAAAVLLLEPFYVAAGFALYLNRRTLLEGWDIEMSLRRLAQRHATAILLVCCMVPLACFAQEKNPKREIAAVLKAPEFPHEVETMQWQRRNPLEPEDSRDRSADDGGWRAIGFALAKAAQVAFWALAAAALAYALWWAARMLPRWREPAPEPYRPPASLFGMEIAPEKLPADVAGAAAALARAGRLREALGLLYRGALSDLVHRRGVELLASHTEAEVLQVSAARLPSDRGFYFGNLVAAWRQCAYGRREPSVGDVERLAIGYRELVA